MQNEKSVPFNGLIGQAKAKRRLGFYLKGYSATGICPHIMFVAPKGCGKTMMAKAMGKLLESPEEKEIIAKEGGIWDECQAHDSNGEPIFDWQDENMVGEPVMKPYFRTVPQTKPFLEINCSTLKNVKQLVNQVLIPHVQHKEATILFDECSELPRDITMALLTMLNPNPENRTTFSYDDYVLDFDFSKHTFMFATTEAQTVFHALMDRCERVDLEEYTYAELGKIVNLTLPSVEFDEGLLDEIATVLRGNARAAQKMANNMAIYLKSQKRKNFTCDDWKEIQHELGIAPLGLSPIEIQILGELGKVKDCSLTHLAAKTGLTKACVQRDFEMYLQKMDLMQITTAGRAITKTGKDYLDELEKTVAPKTKVEPIKKVIKLKLPKSNTARPLIYSKEMPDGFLNKEA
jgi:Holliday junction resolvasome RuvABC ATP-dependent DNA helicase subunit